MKTETKTKTFAYIVKNGEVIATTSTALKNGAEIRFAYYLCEEKLDASRDYQLLNPKWGKISRAKKWDTYETRHFDFPHAQELEPGEFWVKIPPRLIEIEPGVFVREDKFEDYEY